jgi:Mce-associated membrane protein
LNSSDSKPDRKATKDAGTTDTTSRIGAAWEPLRRALGGFARCPGWLAAGLALLLATGVMVTSLVIWRAAEHRRVLAGNQVAAAAAGRVITEKMLGYTYQSFDQHTAEVATLLTGSFRSEFVKAATTVVKPLAVENQAVVVAKVSEVSVMSPGDQPGVRILAFVDQQTTSARLKRAQVDQNRVILTMSEVDGRWLVSRVEAF